MIPLWCVSKGVDEDIQCAVSKTIEVDQKGLFLWNFWMALEHLSDLQNNIFQLRAAGIIGEADIHFDTPYAPTREVFDRIVGDEVVGYGEEWLLERAYFGRTHSHALHDALHAGDLDPFTAFDGVVEEQGDRGEEVGSGIFGCEGEGKTSESEWCHDPCDIDTPIVQNHTDADCDDKSFDDLDDEVSEFPGVFFVYIIVIKHIVASDIDERDKSPKKSKDDEWLKQAMNKVIVDKYKQEKYMDTYDNKSKTNRLLESYDNLLIQACFAFSWKKKEKFYNNFCKKFSKEQEKHKY